jgi:hypothetical protein
MAPGEKPFRSSICVETAGHGENCIDPRGYSSRGNRRDSLLARPHHASIFDVTVAALAMLERLLQWFHRDQEWAVADVALTNALKKPRIQERAAAGASIHPNPLPRVIRHRYRRYPR